MVLAEWSPLVYLPGGASGTNNGCSHAQPAINRPVRLRHLLLWDAVEALVLHRRHYAFKLATQMSGYVSVLSDRLFLADTNSKCTCAHTIRPAENRILSDSFLKIVVDNRNHDKQVHDIHPRWSQLSQLPLLGN